MAFWKSLKKKIFWYKEYFILLFVGIFLILGILLYFPKNKPSPPSEQKQMQNQETTKTKKTIPWTGLTKANFLPKIIYPNPNLFNNLIKNSEVDTSAFIKQYKEHFKIYNSLKGTTSLVFYFYENKEKINAVKIEIKMKLANDQELNGVHELSLLKNE